MSEPNTWLHIHLSSHPPINTLCWHPSPSCHTTLLFFVLHVLLWLPRHFGCQLAFAEFWYSDIHGRIHAITTSPHGLLLLRPQTVKWQLWASVSLSLNRLHFKAMHMYTWTRQQQFCHHTFISRSLDFVPICQSAAPAESNIAHLRCLKKFPLCH